MRTLTFRAAERHEQGTLEALQCRASLNNPGDREALLANPDAIAVPLEQLANGQVFVAESPAGIVGFAALVPRDDGASELDALFVEPDCWRRGIGRALVDYCASVARAEGSMAIHVVGNPHAEDFYRACGFELTGTVETRFGIGLLMRKPL